MLVPGECFLYLYAQTCSIELVGRILNLLSAADEVLTGESAGWKYSTADLCGGGIILTAKSVRTYPRFRIVDLALQLNLHTDGHESTIVSFEITDITKVEEMFPTVARMIGFILREYAGDCILHDEQGIHAGLVRKGSDVIVDDRSWMWSQQDLEALGLPYRIEEIPALEEPA